MREERERIRGRPCKVDSEVFDTHWQHNIVVGRGTNRCTTWGSQVEDFGTYIDDNCCSDIGNDADALPGGSRLLPLGRLRDRLTRGQGGHNLRRVEVAVRQQGLR